MTLTSTPLTKEGVFVGSGFSQPWSAAIAGTVFADQEGTLHVEQSSDGTNWDVDTSYTITASDGKGFYEQVVAPYWRVKYVNGASAQGVFRLNAFVKV